MEDKKQRDTFVNTTIRKNINIKTLKINIMKFPESLLYTKDHEWIRNDGDFAFIGITDFAQKELGDIVYADIGTLGEKLKQHEVFGTVEAVKTVSDLFLPLSGEIVEINSKIISNPELINKDPYGDGWLVKIKVQNEEDSSELLYAAEYRQLIGLDEKQMVE